MENYKRLIISFVFLFILFGAMSSVSAYKWACLSYGDTVPHYTCEFSNCKLCLDDNGYPTAFGYCDKAKNCVFGPANNDTTPPLLTINSPVDNFIYNSSKILFNLTTNEPSTIYYKNSQDSDNNFKMLAGNRLNYVNLLSFKDGFYNITIRAEDRSGNDADIPKSFYVDTKTPKVDTPKDNNNGTISFKFEEANPVTISLKLGNNATGYGTYNIDLNNCNGTDGKYNCIYNITKEIGNSALTPYNGQQVETWIEIKDIAGNIGSSKKLKRTIDLDPPVINNPSTMFSVSGNYAVFNINITEKNLAGVYYSENTSKLNIHKLCSSLKDGICYKKVSFGKGAHDIMVIVIDNAGNYARKEFKFTI